MNNPYSKKIFFAISFITFILVIVAIIAISNYFSDRSKPQMVEETAIFITLENIADHVGEKIVIEGIINDVYTGCQPSYYCFKIEPLNYSFNDTPIMLQIDETTETGKPNCYFLTESAYGEKLFSFYTTDGQTRSLHDSFRVTGIISFYKGSSKNKGAYWILVSTIEPGK